MDTLFESGAHELVITRDLKASRERVFAAWTDPRLAAHWWVPRSCSLVSCEMDVRPGGAWQRRMRVPDGTVIAKYGVYREVARPERLVFTYATRYADGTVDPETVVILTFADLEDGRTRLTLRHVNFQAEEQRSGHEGGWTSCLDGFVEYIETN
jgi:uncharacterized protein YndB with AHSA1/START domain